MSAPRKADEQGFAEPCTLLTIPVYGGAKRILVLGDGSRHELGPVPSLDANIVNAVLSLSPVAPKEHGKS
jgi:hypothetical protein